jgi:surfeit locus 1 family protein
VIVGELRTPPNPSPMAPPPANGRFYTRDGAAMARALGVEGPLRPEVVFAVSTANPETPTLRPSAPPPAFSNNHLGYALTWFGLAIALVGFYAALLRRRLKKELP